MNKDLKLFSWLVQEGIRSDEERLELLITRFKFCDGIIYTCGNGGSSSNASHFTQDLIKICGKKSICISDNIPFILATANDDDFKNIFRNYMKVFYTDKDMLFMISGSGNSENLVRVAIAMEGRLKTSALLGFDGGKLLNLVDYPVHIPCHDMLTVESVHSALLHYIVYRLSHDKSV